MNKSRFSCVLFAALAVAACSPATPPAAVPEPTTAAFPDARVMTSCPHLTMAARPGTAPSREVTIAAVIENPPAGVTYNWAVTAGDITSGQGTATIKVDPPVGELFSASVEVANAPETCFATTALTVP